MKSFLDLVRHRQSDRQYDAREVETEKLERVLEAARLAPSACNAQPWRMIVVTDAQKRMKIADATSSRILGMNHFTKQAPVQIVIVEENANIASGFGGWAKGKHFPHVDLGILAAHITLAAADEGLGTCVLGWFSESKVKEILEIPKSKKVLLVITMGYSTQPTREKRRKDASEVISYEKY